MSIFEWFFVGACVLSFGVIMFFSWSDLARDILFYREKKKNVKHIAKHKQAKASRR